MMFRSLIFRPKAILFRFVFVILLQWPGSGVASLLEEARQAYKDNQISLAREFYNKISPADPQWDDKLEDSIRWFIKEKRFQSAWRLTQLAQRTSRDIPGIDYYEKLSALKFGACPFGSSAKPLSRELLVRAYGARFYTRFSKPLGEVSDGEGLRNQGLEVTFLADFATPYLADLKKTKLITNRGCRFDRPSYSGRQEAEEAELDYLRQFSSRVLDHPEEQPESLSQVRIRMIQLAMKLRYKDLAEENLKYFMTLDPKEWGAMRDPDRIFVWTNLKRGGLVPSGKVSSGSLESQIVKEILLTSNTKYASSWLSLVDFDQWPSGERHSLYKNLTIIDGLPLREEIVLRQALMSFEKGDHQESILFLKQIFDSPTSSEVTRSGALTIMERLLSRFQFNQTMLGAIQGALPVNLWSYVYQSILVDHSLRGDLKGFVAIKNLAQSPSSRRVLSQKNSIQIELYEFLAYRRMKEFYRTVDQIRESHGRIFLDVAKLVSERSAGLTQEEFLKVEPAFRYLAKKIREDMDMGKTQNQSLPILTALERKPIDKRAEAEKLAQGGVSHAGSVSIRPLLEFQNLFQWDDVDSLPLRDLLAVPNEVTDRNWKIE